MTIALSPCIKCKHYKRNNQCTAFTSIPFEIQSGKNDHKKPFPGDNGIQFEPIEESKKSIKIP